MSTPMSMNALAMVPEPHAPAGAAPPQRDKMTSKQTFMKLLVAQLRHQDPLNPVENTELVSQLAAVSSVEHLAGIREMMDKRADDHRLSGVAFAGSLVNKKVGLDGDVFTLTGAPAGLDVSYVMPDNGDALVVRLLDDTGRQVGQHQARGKPGAEQTSSLARLFGRRLPAGRYQMVAQAASGQGSDLRLHARVRSVDWPEYGGEPRLVLEGTTPTALSRIRSVH
ncbi:MAG: hypothetical protein OXC07_08275 [Kistimonas sp.]|nr:hypothetical protein [Kistimonas sp.]